MGSQQQQYRLYFLGGDGHITLSHELEAADDAAALWSGRRKVHSWEAGPNSR